MRLAGKTAVVTGGANGIGAAIVAAFLQQGAAVVIADVDAEAAAAAAEAARGRGASAIATRTDVTDPESVASMLRDAEAVFGPVNVLVANAGVNVFCEPLAMDAADWRRCFAVDLDGVWNSARAVLPGMIASGGGSIVALASVHSTTIIPGCFPYPVAKHAVIGLVRALGVEYARAGVRVNAIAPGYVETELALAHWASFDDPDAERDKVHGLHPPGRIGRPEEVAMTAVFLASDEAPFINASTITIDGGRSVVYHD
ncbi:SDR family oxidoreductase [Sphingomonas sp. Tas61C01]|uniref:SDR family oxidoreductase n=1 Tax=Sphingomonas sp. Tas61C01 TaxID=3458297 RepID=UPI00403EE1B9